LACLRSLVNNRFSYWRPPTMGEHNVNSENGPQELRGFIKHLLNDI